MVGRALLGFALVLAVAGPAAAQDGRAIELDLNRMDEVDTACRLTFVADNTLAPLSALALETVVFDRGGRVAALSVFDFDALPEGARRVRQFDVAGVACADVAQVLVNGVAACAGEGPEPEGGPDLGGCVQALRLTGSVEGVEVAQ